VANPQEPVPTPSLLRASLQEKLPDYMVPATFVMLENLPLTPNGKVDRKALPLPAAKDLERGVDPAVPRNETERILAHIWCQLLGLSHVGIHDNFFELGGDSIVAIQIASRARHAGLKLTPRHCFLHRTIAELAAVTVSSRAVEADQGQVIGPVPMTPIQQWFFEQDCVEPQHWNQAILLAVAPTADAALFGPLIERLLEHHDALRMRFTRDGQSWRQINAATDAVSHFSVQDSSELEESEQRRTLESTAQQIQASLNLSKGPVFRAVFFDMGVNRPGRLLLVAHHLVIDAVSWRILLEDFQVAYQQSRNRETVSLPAKTTSFRDWATRLCQYAQSEQPEKELAYWLGRPWSQVGHVRVDSSGGANDEASTRSSTVSLSDQETQTLLQKVPESYRTGVDQVLLAAVAFVVAQWSSTPVVCIDVEGHGRQEDLIVGADVSRTVGWFTSVFPVLLNTTWRNPAEALGVVREQFRTLPHRGIGYGILRYVCQEALARRLRDLPRPEISFNYLGQFDRALSDSLLYAATESSGPSRSPRQKRPYLLEINGMVRDGKLQMRWTYSENVHRRETIDALADHCLAALRNLIIQRPSPGTGGDALPNFPLVRMIELTPEELETISATASKAGPR
ncbi:MAG TPA: condensation domain-containing protein, partial [Candidatus Acidoferrales bacterium]|nr:condensation domain-containing protein [Candidatus Acidoferrales bacterium]